MVYIVVDWTQGSLSEMVYLVVDWTQGSLSEMVYIVVDLTQGSLSEMVCLVVDWTQVAWCFKTTCLVAERRDNLKSVRRSESL